MSSSSWRGWPPASSPILLTTPVGNALAKVLRDHPGGPLRWCADERTRTPSLLIRREGRAPRQRPPAQVQRWMRASGVCVRKAMLLYGAAVQHFGGSTLKPLAGYHLARPSTSQVWAVPLRRGDPLEVCGLAVPNGLAG